MNAATPSNLQFGRRAAGSLRLSRWLVACALLAFLPLLFLGFSNGLHDGWIHQIWSGQLAKSIIEVDSYPRWLAGINGGLGSPAMFFYPVLPYLVAVPVVPSVGAAHALALGAVVSAVIAGVAMQRLLRLVAQPAAARAGAVLYVTAPYFLGTDLYTRGAYAEYWAFAWLPVVLLGVVKLRRNGLGQSPSESGNALEEADSSSPPPAALFLGERILRKIRALIPETRIFTTCWFPTGNRIQFIGIETKEGVRLPCPSQAGATGVWDFHLVGGVLLLALGYGALVATHLPTTLVFSLVPLALASVPVGGTRWWDWSWGRWRPFASTIIGMTLGIGLAAPYLIPALTMQEQVSLEALTSWHKYDRNFFFGEVGWGRFHLGHAFKRTLYLPFLATATMGLMGFLIARGGAQKVDRSRLTSAAPAKGEQDELRRMRWFFLTLLSTSVFMMLPWSDFVWRLIPKLQIIQFPWRICSVLTVAAVMLVTLGLDALRRPLTQRATLQVYFLMVAIAGGLAYTGEAIWRFVETAPLVEVAASSTANYDMDVPEYRPRWTKQDLRTTVEALRRTPADFEREEGMTNGAAWVDLAARQEDPLIGARTIDGGAELAVVEWRSRKLRLACTNERPATLQVSQLYFPGWTARREGRELTLRPSEPAGLLEVDLPAGQGEITIVLEPLWPERTGNRVGWASACVWMIGYGWLLGRRKFDPTGKLTRESS